jgi:hypothetical protein
MPAAAGPPLEEKDAIGPVRDGLVGAKSHASRGLGVVDLPLRDGAGGLLHEQPGRAAQGAHQVEVERRGDMGVLLARIGIDVQRDGVLLAGPPPVVRSLVEAHEVGEDRDVAAVGADDVAFGEEAFQQGVRYEPGEVQPAGGVRPRARYLGRADLIPGRVALAPEPRVPRVVQRVQVAVLVPQPGAEGVRAAWRVGDGAVFIADVPHGQRRVPGVPLGERARDPGRVLAVDQRRGVVVQSVAEAEDVPVACDGERFLVLVGQPGRRRRGGRGQVDADPVRVQ